jgi:ABC-type transporter Mla subunit MlaD
VEIARIKGEMDKVFAPAPGAPTGDKETTGTPVTITAPAGTPVPSGKAPLAATGPSGFGAALDQAVARQREAAAKIQEEMQHSAEAVKDMLDPTRALNRKLKHNHELYEAGYLTAEEYAHAQQDVQRRIGEARGGFEEINVAIDETNRTLNQFAVQGARNIQNALADFFFEPFEQGLSGLSDSLRRTLNRMAADIVAAQLAKKLFGDYGSGGGIETIDYIRDTLTREEFVGYCIGNSLKYHSRWRHKGGVEDLKKARRYLVWAIEREEAGITEDREAMREEAFDSCQ